MYDPEEPEVDGAAVEEGPSSPHHPLLDADVSEANVFLPTFTSVHSAPSDAFPPLSVALSGPSSSTNVAASSDVMGTPWSGSGGGTTVYDELMPSSSSLVDEAKPIYSLRTFPVSSVGDAFSTHKNVKERRWLGSPGSKDKMISIREKLKALLPPLDDPAVAHSAAHNAVDNVSRTRPDSGHLLERSPLEARG